MSDYLILSKFKLMLHVGFSDDDFELSKRLDAAESYLGDPENGILQRQVIKKSFTEHFSSFSAVCLEWPDVVSDVIVTYLDASENTQTLGSIYTVNDGRLVLNYGEKWPSPAKNITVSYSSGWDAPDVPEGICDLGYFIARTFYTKGVEIDQKKFKEIVAFQAAPFRRSGI